MVLKKVVNSDVKVSVKKIIVVKGDTFVLDNVFKTVKEVAHRKLVLGVGSKKIKTFSKSVKSMTGKVFFSVYKLK